ncbi:sodium-translocating pyrophosphatase [Candidatus Saccharibacteria bacterium]|nr:sodium-translocating pyrophosphatase [Candidatus Saccharibacteria bacterium]
MVQALILGAIGCALLLMIFNYISLKNLNEGTTEMAEIAKIIRDGAKTFMVAEYRTIIVVVAIVAIMFSLFIEKTSGLTFILGATMSSATCIIGMRSATYANVRTANKAYETKSIGETVKIALMGGSVSGLSVQAFGLLGLLLIIMITGGIDLNGTGSGFIPVLKCNPTIMWLTTYSLGCSLVAMFNRVAGGNYTKAADISADIVAKVRNDMPEDDSRMPNTIADFIGDNVNDVAGNCSDLLESFVATIVASLLIAASIAESNTAVFQATITYPLILAGGGLLGCVIGLFFTLKHKSGKDPSHELNIATYISAAAVILIGGIAAFFTFGQIKLYDSFILGWASPWIASILGIASGVAIGKITEYYTSTKYRSVQSLAEIAKEGSAFVITKGDAIGSRSCLLPILVIGLSLLGSGMLCGVYGVAISALGMLSFVATTVSIDAFGPIADNAGGIAESCHLEPEVRNITDQLDAVGNTTAAIGKGFAIGSAAFATVSLIFAYVGSYSVTTTPILNIANFVVIAGGLVGGALIEYFSALLTDNTIESAHLMANEGSRQLKIPGIIEGTKRPDYEKCIHMATKQALHKMLIPSLLALLIPVIGGLFFGVEFVGGLLIGATIVAIPRAIFMGNSGGAFDNAKKHIESGGLKEYGKGSDPHKASVVGDTVGDTRKDVVGVALDIFIKTMSTVANTLAPLFASFHIF